MTILLQDPTISTTSWIMRSNSCPISGNEIKRYKQLYPTRESPVAPGLVSTIQLGNICIAPPSTWIGLQEDHTKFLTNKDLAQGSIYAQVSDLLVNTRAIQSEKVCPVDLVNFIVFGDKSDESKLISQHRTNLIQEHNEFQLKYLFDWALNSTSSAHDLVLGLINAMMFLHPAEFHYMCESWCKNLPQYCRIDEITLKTKISENHARMLCGGLLFNRSNCESVEIQSLNFQVNEWFYEGSKTRRPCLISIDRNSICIPAFTSEVFQSKVEVDSEGFLTCKFRLELLGRTITTLVLSMDRQDGQDLIECQSSLLTTIAIRIENSLLIMAMRKLPDFVCLDRNLRMERISSDIYKDNLLSKMVMNLSTSTTGTPNSLFYSRFDVLSTNN